MAIKIWQSQQTFIVLIKNQYKSKYNVHYDKLIQFCPCDMPKLKYFIGGNEIVKIVEMVENCQKLSTLLEIVKKV